MKPKLKPKVKATRESKYYGIPIRIKPKLVDRINNMDTRIKPFNTKLSDLLDRLVAYEKWNHGGGPVPTPLEIST